MNKKLFSDIEKLHPDDADNAYKRAEALIKAHKTRSNEPVRLFSAPGRIEVVGNHTDHNNGKVIAAAVNLDTLAAVTPENGNIISIYSEGYPDVIVDINDLSVYPDQFGLSDAIVRGVLKGFLDRGFKIGAFSATTSSQVFKAAGMSSSSAFEVLVSEILNVFYNDGKIDAVTRAVISQFAENVYFGKPSGLMDQTAIAVGGRVYIDFKDPKSPIVKKLK